MQHKHYPLDSSYIAEAKLCYSLVNMGNYEVLSNFVYLTKAFSTIRFCWYLKCSICDFFNFTINTILDRSSIISIHFLINSHALLLGTIQIINTLATPLIAVAKHLTAAWQANLSREERCGGRKVRPPMLSWCESSFLTDNLKDSRITWAEASIRNYLE